MDKAEEEKVEVKSETEVPDVPEEPVVEQEQPVELEDGKDDDSFDSFEDPVVA